MAYSKDQRTWEDQIETNKRTREEAYVTIIQALDPETAQDSAIVASLVNRWANAPELNRFEFEDEDPRANPLTYIVRKRK